jgi:hypothetical protein
MDRIKEIGYNILKKKICPASDIARAQFFHAGILKGTIV